MRTIVYVDGFNLYYGCLAKSPHKWLDLGALCRALLPKNDIQQIRYYTARVRARPGALDQPVRQDTYLRALRTIPCLTIHEGHFLEHKVMARAVTPPPRYVEVFKTEEKGSDVNIAAHLVSDAYEDRFDVAVLITNDSDLCEPIKIVKQRLRKVVGLLNPRARDAVELKRIADFMKPIRRGALGASQFPTTMTDAVGTITKPAAW